MWPAGVRCREPRRVAVAGLRRLPQPIGVIEHSEVAVGRGEVLWRRGSRRGQTGQPLLRCGELLSHLFFERREVGEGDRRLADHRGRREEEGEAQGEPHGRGLAGGEGLRPVPCTSLV